MQTAQQASDRIRDFLWNRLYCPETSLFYDNLFPDGTFSSGLPTPEELALDIPNPCGWGTGMEDGMMIAGIIVWIKQKNPHLFLSGFLFFLLFQSQLS